MNEQEILSMKETADKLGLLHAQILSEYPLEVLVREFNGVGPDRWPAELRDVLTWLLKDVLEAVFIHDMDYYKGGTKEEYHESNLVLGKNVRKLARKRYGWWRPRRWFLTRLSHKITEWTDKYGWEGWNKK